MERAGYRENLEMLNARYPDHDILTRTEVARLYGVKLETLKKWQIPFDKTTKRISKADLARAICNGAR